MWGQLFIMSANLWPSFWTQFEALENERHSAAICPLLVCQDENERLAAEWRTFLKAHYASESGGHEKSISSKSV